MRIVTRPDFDGIVCAVLLQAAETVTLPIYWVEPSEIQKGTAQICQGDILANLPYDPRCSLWFDHHFSNQIQTSFRGAWRLAPSAAGVIHDFYRQRLESRFSELVRQADKIDAAELTLDEVQSPERYPYILLSMTISGRERKDEPYWNLLVDELGTGSIETVMALEPVKDRCRQVVENNQRYRDFLLAYTKLYDHVAVTDMRSHPDAPDGNRFLSYSLFPECSVHVKARRDARNPQRVSISVGHSIFNRTCNVNVGVMLSAFEGGGHRGAGGCNIDASRADACLGQIISILHENAPNTPEDGLQAGGCL